MHTHSSLRLLPVLDGNRLHSECEDTSPTFQALDVSSSSRYEVQAIVVGTRRGKGLQLLSLQAGWYSLSKALMLSMLIKFFLEIKPSQYPTILCVKAHAHSMFIITYCYPIGEW